MTAPPAWQETTAFAAGDHGPVGEFPEALSYPPGVVLLCQGEVVREVHLLERGLVKLLRLEASGEEAIVGLRSAGWILGASAAVLDRPCFVTAVTVTPCRVSRLAAPSFRQLVVSSSTLSWRLHRMLSEEICDHLVRAAERDSLSARERLENLLSQLAAGVVAGKPERGCRIQLPLRQWELAGLIGVSPQWLSRILGELEKEGVLRREREVIVLQAPMLAGASQPKTGPLHPETS